MPQVKLLEPADARRTLGRYEILGEIASGGMGTVYLARRAGVGGFERFFAVKQLHPHLAREQEYVDMFLDEARLTARIHHPHVVPILEVDTTEAPRGGARAHDDARACGKSYYLAMEYIEGGTLAHLLARADARGEPVPGPVLIRILLDVLAGLHAAHELTDGEGEPIGLVHRDCSPQNILVGADGCSRLTDFGVARAASRLAHTGSGRLKGKLSYMAPEQARGRAIDRRADLFSMGIVLWEALSGRRLFQAPNQAVLLSRVMSAPIPPLRDVAPAAPSSLEAVCARALERDVGRRFQSAAEMADALEQASREATGGAASPRAVASYVNELLGEELAAQRDRVRAWLHRQASAAAAGEALRADDEGEAARDGGARRDETGAQRDERAPRDDGAQRDERAPRDDDGDETIRLAREVGPAAPVAFTVKPPDPSLALDEEVSFRPRRGRVVGTFAAAAGVVVLLGWTALRTADVAPESAPGPAQGTALAAACKLETPPAPEPAPLRPKPVDTKRAPGAAQPERRARPAAVASPRKPAAPARPQATAEAPQSATLAGYMSDPYR